MADAGGGHFYYIERPEQITDLIASEVGELLEIVARDAAFELTAPDGMTIRPLSPYRFEGRGNRSVLLLGDLVAGQHLEAVARIKFGYGKLGSEIGALVGATDRDGVLAAAGTAPVAIGWQYADDRANDIELTAPDGMTIRPLSPYRFEQRGNRSMWSRGPEGMAKR